MNGDEMIWTAAAVGGLIWLAFLAFYFLVGRLWLQAMLADVSVSMLDVVRMRLRRCPPKLVIQAMTDLARRGITVTAREAEACYLAAAVHGERVATAAELADLLEEVKRNPPDAPHP